MTTELVPTDTAVASIPAGAGDVHIFFILDRSGSMQGSEADVIGGFNSFVATLRAQPALGACTVSVTRFDTEIEQFWRALPLDDVPAMDNSHFTPRGSTALLDAVGVTLSSVQDQPEDRYLVIIHTDGAENASREWTVDKVRSLITTLTQKGNWSFAFFGADTDAWTAAESYGMAADSSMGYQKSRTREAYSANARVVSMMRSDASIRSSSKMGKATQAAEANPALTEEEIDRILRES